MTIKIQNKNIYKYNRQIETIQGCGQPFENDTRHDNYDWMVRWNENEHNYVL